MMVGGVSVNEVHPNKCFCQKLLDNDFLVILNWTLLPSTWYKFIRSRFNPWQVTSSGYIWRLQEKIIKTPCAKDEEIHPLSMLFIHDIDNNILNYGARFLSVYQDESEKWDIYLEINIHAWVATKQNPPPFRNCGTRYSRNNQHIKNINSPRHFWKGTGCHSIMD